MHDERFDELLWPDELVAWDCIKAVIENCLGKTRSENCRVLVHDMLNAFESINVHMSLKIHFLHCHWDYFEAQMPTESDEHGERFYQVAAPLENWYSGKKLDSLLADLCWNLMEEALSDQKDSSES